MVLLMIQKDMEDESVSPIKQFYNISGSSNSSSPKRKIRLSRILITILIIFVLGGTGFAITQAFKNSNQKKIERSTIAPTPTTTPIPTETPSPTPDVSITPSPSAKITPSTKISPSPSGKITPSAGTTATQGKLTVEVLNGSGTAGAGKKAANILTGLGYTVSSTGNADNFDYTNTVIQVKSTKSASLAQLKKDLSGTYTIGTATSDLPASTATDARVIVGKQ